MKMSWMTAARLAVFAIAAAVFGYGATVTVEAIQAGAWPRVAGCGVWLAVTAVAAMLAIVYPRE